LCFLVPVNLVAFSTNPYPKALSPLSTKTRQPHQASTPRSLSAPQPRSTGPVEETKKSNDKRGEASETRDPWFRSNKLHRSRSKECPSALQPCMLETRGKAGRAKRWGNLGLTHRKVTFLGVTCGWPVPLLVWLGACQSNLSGKCRIPNAHARERKRDGGLIGPGLVRSGLLFLLCNEHALWSQGSGAALIGIVYVCWYHGMHAVTREYWNADDRKKSSLVLGSI
jgi:hypothetical protein